MWSSRRRNTARSSNLSALYAYFAATSQFKRLKRACQSWRSALCPRALGDTMICPTLQRIPLLDSSKEGFGKAWSVNFYIHPQHYISSEDTMEGSSSEKFRYWCWMKKRTLSKTKIHRSYLVYSQRIAYSSDSILKIRTAPEPLRAHEELLKTIPAMNPPPSWCHLRLFKTSTLKWSCQISASERTWTILYVIFGLHDAGEVMKKSCCKNQNRNSFRYSMWSWFTQSG